MISIFCLQSGGRVQAPAAEIGDTDTLKGASERLDNMVADQSQLAISYKRGNFELSNILQLTYEQVPHNSEAIHAELASAFPERETHLTLVTLRNTIIKPPEYTSALKRMSLLQRRPDINASRFQHEWFTLHGLLVKRLKGVIGYNQNLVVSQMAGSSTAKIDGMVELWFENADAIQNAFQTDEGTTLMTHAKEFIGEITTFLVEPRPLK
jgi:uncharacterized protein (TIGR02118 family)